MSSSKIGNFIQKKITARYLEHRLLVVYDPTGRLKSIATSVAKKQQAQFIDAASGVLEALKKAELALQAGLEKGVVLYAPYAEPQSSTDKIKDLFGALAEIGNRWPNAAADSYLQLCLQALPQKEAAVRQLFDQCGDDKGPDFSLVDALFDRSGSQWPMLSGLSGLASDAEILRWLLTAGNEVYQKASGELSAFAEKM